MLRSFRSLSFALAATSLLLVPAAANAKSSKLKYPSVSRVSPSKLGVGDTMVIRGKGFRSGKKKNFVVFKRSGMRAIFVRADRATSTKITLVVPIKVLAYLVRKKGVAQYTRFRVRILSAKLGKRWTSLKSSPLIGPAAITNGSPDDCDGDSIPNSVDGDDDNDLLSDTQEAELGTQSCKRDTDGDGLSDGWEQHSATDRNGGNAKPSPRKRPYPNALDPADGKGVDADGDGLTNLEEYIAWATYGGNKLPLSYSGGNPASAGKLPVAPEVAYMDRDHNGFLSDLERDADGDGIPNMDEGGREVDTARLALDGDGFTDFGIFTVSYLTEAEKATNEPALRCGGINQVPFYCFGSEQPFKVDKVDQLDWLDGDSDGDTIRDDQDDVDHDDVANITEYMTELSTAVKDRRYAPLNACVPSTDARFCLLGTVDIDKDGLANRDDADDDGDQLPDTLEQQEAGTDPLLADTDGDGVSDSFEYYSAKDLNEANNPYPGKRPYPNPLDKTDANSDFDQDSLTQKEESQAWLLTGGALPLSYSDGTQHSGGTVGTDDDKDVDGDGLTNYQETHGPLSGPGWWDAWVAQDNVKCTSSYVETHYPGPDYLGTSFVDWDTDGDKVKDGDDDIDHDGYSNAQESTRPANWCSTYISGGSFTITPHPGSDKLARMQPFNPCKPTYSDACHIHPPLAYYGKDEDWESPFHENGPVSTGP